MIYAAATAIPRPERKFATEPFFPTSSQPIISGPVSRRGSHRGSPDHWRTPDGAAAGRRRIASQYFDKIESCRKRAPPTAGAGRR